MHRRRRPVLATLVLVSSVGLATLGAAPATAAPVPSIAVGIAPSDVVFSRDGARAYVANEGSKSISVISVSTSTVTSTISLPHAPHSLSVSPDGSKLYAAT